MIDMVSKWQITNHKFLKEMIVFEGVYNNNTKFTHCYFEPHTGAKDFTSFEIENQMPEYTKENENGLFGAINAYVKDCKNFEQDYIYNID